jgi:hypothetical protein
MRFAGALFLVQLKTEETNMNDCYVSATDFGGHTNLTA